MTFPTNVVGTLKQSLLLVGASEDIIKQEFDRTNWDMLWQDLKTFIGNVGHDYNREFLYFCFVDVFDVLEICGLEDKSQWVIGGSCLTLYFPSLSLKTIFEIAVAARDRLPCP